MLRSHVKPYVTLFNLQEAVGMVHLQGYMYKWVMGDLGKTFFP